MKTNWHSKSIEEALLYFNSDIEKGLSETKVNESKEKYGLNELPSGKSKSKLLLFLQQFNNPIIYILILAAALTSLVADPTDAIVIGAVVLLNTIIGYVQELKASAALESLKKMTSSNARIIRDGRQLTVESKELVPGDILLLESGLRTPADARLIETRNLLVDESMLTGESFSINKDANVELGEETPLGDRINMAYSGSIIQRGRATAIVIATGINTEFGKISKNVSEADEQVSPLQKNIEKFGKKLSIAILAAISIIFFAGFLQGKSWVQMMLTAIGLAVSAIPEGLPVAVTITLSVGLYQMAKRNAVIKKLAAVETLGSANIICTDKTGTLTKNQMSVTHLYAGGIDYHVEASGYKRAGNVKDLDGKPVDIEHNKALTVVDLIGKYCTESSIEENGDEWKINGDPTEAALMILADKIPLDDADWKIYVDVPFESELQFMAVRAQKNGRKLLLAKGAAEKIVERCSSMIDSNINIIQIDKEKIYEKAHEFSEEGLRSLALAYKEFEEDAANADSVKDMVFAGIAGIEDSVRLEARDAVLECADAGIRVIMITGDHVKTAAAVGKNVGIAAHKDAPKAMPGVELEKMSDEELYNAAEDIDVYARVAPDHKYRIVKQLQKRGSIVAMTGDGVNDAPALKQADIGIAMGSGTDVAKEAGDMTLMDDNFATIVQAVRRGRIILLNLQHIILYVLSTSLGGLLTIATSVFLGFPLPALPAQLLWINLVTDGISTFPLAYEKEHGNVMKFPPRSKEAPLIPKEMVFRMAISGIIMMLGTLTLFYYSFDDINNFSNIDLRKAQTIGFSVLAFFQIWNVQNSRSVNRSLFFNLPYLNTHLDRINPFKNPALVGIMILSAILQFGAVQLPFMNVMLHTVPLNLNEWLLVIGTSFSIIVIIEIVKFIEALINRNKARIIL